MLQRKGKIFLVGMMGSGKTTLGKRVAREIGMSFIDLDREIERRTGVSVGTIFEFEGEAGFRARESHLLKEICQSDGGACIVATGGGVVLSPLNRARLQACGYVIYLHALPNLLYARTKTDRGRPLLQVEDPFAKIVELVARRDPLYREVADIVIEAGQEMTTSIAQIVASISKE
ncbi:MAG: shikimate kinase [Rhodocyclaceae bacterium]|nr:shikimate kinase [Rhodocyclaceae bacterium]